MSDENEQRGKQRDFRIEPPRDIWEVADELADAVRYLLDQHGKHSPHLCSYCESGLSALLHLQEMKKTREPL